jgi:hypothetical protein
LSSCPSISLSYSLYNIITGRRKEELKKEIENTLWMGLWKSDRARRCEFYSENEYPFIKKRIKRDNFHKLIFPLTK